MASKIPDNVERPSVDKLNIMVKHLYTSELTRKKKRVRKLKADEVQTEDYLTVFGVPGASVNLGEHHPSLKRFESGVLTLEKLKDEKVFEDSELDKMRDRIKTINEERY